jgi:hypothetical protein
MTVDELRAALREIPADVEIRLADKASYEFKVSEVALVFFAGSPPSGNYPPVACIVAGDPLGELADEARNALGW